MEIKDKDGNVINRVFSLTKEGEEALKEFGLPQPLSKEELIKQLREIINNEMYNSKRWVTQKEEDMNLKPSGCAMCGERRLIEDKQGWKCLICETQINALSYYQGANAKAMKIKKRKGIKL